ncbi:MAG: sugar ABC transporter ATP-binding protein [Actinobacteria bacterium]|nr:sugar ABC transporter ATP-binding protein [Actinomycetota bacterium]MCA1722056.1 sugar ABC transporter ATP-binding protein [Actinomycetota bacterium]
MTAPAELDRKAAVAVRGLSKTYAGTLALDSLDLDIRPGEIHALLGGNGSGKSTTIKILAGVVSPDEGGELTFGDGDTVHAESWTPARAHAAGLRFVHQQPAVFPELTVAENLAIGAGFPRRAGGGIDWKALNARTAVLLEKYRVNATPTTPLGALRAADRSRVAIVRALQDSDDAEGGLLVLDEPTAALPAAEVEHLLETLRGYAAAGQTILYVSHRLDEVLSVADRVTVLRDGRKVDTVHNDGLTESDLVQMIVGRAMDRAFPAPRETPAEDVALQVRGLAGGPLRGVDLDLRRGEVLGIAGLLGSGRSELLRMLFGAYPATAGSVTLDGKRYDAADPKQAMRAGVAYVPEERQADAVFAQESVRHNLSAGQAWDFYRNLFFRHADERTATTRSISEFLVRTRSDKQPVETLSGGNQQKVVLARWLRQRPKVLLLDEPTQGVDVQARAEIYDLVRRATAAGTSVLLVASDTEELAHASDRIAVLKGGRITAVVEQPLDAHHLTELMNVSETTP